MSQDISSAAVAVDLETALFKRGVLRGFWHVVSFEFPILLMEVSATHADGSLGKYHFRFELNGYPGIAPHVQIWDLKGGGPLPANLRPKTTPRVSEAFKSWGPDTVYRPWERSAGAHNNWNTSYPDLAWSSNKKLTFVLEDLHGLLNIHPAASPVQAAA